MSTTNTLTWNKNPEASVVKYNIYRALGAAPTETLAQKIGSILAPALTFVDTVTVDGDYFYAVTAVSSFGIESTLSNVVDKVVNTVPPSAPTGLIVV